MCKSAEQSNVTSTTCIPSILPAPLGLLFAYAAGGRAKPLAGCVQ